MAFVKFSRGLLQTYNSLTRKDPDTLYLVYENENSASGSLYLGTKLISSVSSGAIVTSLSDLTDVVISGELEDGMLLQYNTSTGNGIWEAVPLSEVLSGVSTQNENVSIVEALNEISDPSTKDFAVVGTNLYIYDGSDWVQLTDTSLASRISNLESQVGHAANAEEGIAATGLYADIAAIQTSLGNVYTKTEVNNYVASQIAAAQHLRYEIVNSIENIDVEDPSVENTIYLVPKSNAEINDGYEEYFVINETLEKIGDWGVDLSNYVQTNDNRLLTEPQKTKIDAITLDENNNIVIQAAQVGGLIQTIQDNQIIKSVQAGTFSITQEGELQLQSVPTIDLSGYVQTSVFNAAVGDLSQLTNSTLVDEINMIKTSIIWQEMQANNTGE